VLVAMGARASWLCVSPAEKTIELGSQQRWEQMTLQARRGSIFDRHGKRLVSSVDTPTVAVDPERVHPDEVMALSRKVARLLGVSVEEVAEKMRRRPSRYAKLAARVHPKVALDILDLDHDALFVESDQKRYYPEGSLGAHLLGHVDLHGTGQSGIEASLDPWLRGDAVLLQRRRDRKGLDVQRMREVDRTSPAGKDVYLTLDRRIQRITERALAGVVERHQPVATMAVVVDVKTGDLLALANTPTFNPNAIPSDPELMKNRIVLDAIEPGSVFKPFVAAAAIEEGKVRVDSKIDCEGGRWAVGRSRIGDDHPHGVITVGEVIKYSSNIGSAKMAFMLGATTYLDYMRNFGFGERTGLPFPGERRGRLRSADNIKPIELATTSYGQGATATALQLTYATATIANGGVRMRPRLVTRVVDEDGVPSFVQEPEPLGQVISAQTARDMTEAMVTVTETGGTATRARVPGYRVAGKTGTAWKVEGGHYTDARISSFIGFVPADDPKLAIVIVVDDAQIGSRYGGIAAAPAFADIAREALPYLSIPPDPALLALEKKAPANDSKKPETEDIPQPLPSIDFVDDGSWVVPDLSGATVREALSLLEGTGLSVRVHGSGRLAAMEPPAGTPLPPGADLRLTFQ
jgi:cell division protein FtsI (penicillin-binding protein 3)